MEGESSSSTSDTPSESEHLLSFVTDQDGGMVSIHTDLAGIKLLISKFQWLQAKLEKDICEHTHLGSWDRDELTPSKLSTQPSEVHLVHHVKIYGWNETWATQHGLKKRA